MEACFYTVKNINGDYAELEADDGREITVTLFLLPDGVDIGSRLKKENFQWETA